MSSNVAIEVKGISKQYFLYETPTQRLKELLFGGRHHRVFHALQQTNLKIMQGEVLGILGRNGAGKSTLLQILAGTLSQTSGTIDVNGTITALLELGSGFNPDFTGRENIFLYGTILGMTRKYVTTRLDEILEFADIAEFIDRPLKTYSSGMGVRLAFSTLVLLEPDIMIVDEALAVGDAQFKAKCMRHINSLKNMGKTFVLVSHSTDQILTFCTRAIVVEAGEIIFEGSPKEVAHIYKTLLFPKSRVDMLDKLKNTDNKAKSMVKNKMSKKDIHPLAKSEFRFGTGEAKIEKIEVLNSQREPASMVMTNEEIIVRLTIVANKRIDHPVCGFRIKNKLGVDVYIKNTEHDRLDLPPLLPKKEQIVEFNFYANLVGGEYFLSVGLIMYEKNENVALDRRMDVYQISVVSSDASTGIANLNASFKSM